MFNAFADFVESPSFTDMMVRPGEPVMVKSPSGWGPLKDYVIDSAGESELVLLGQSSGLGETWREDLFRTRKSINAVFEITDANDNQVRVRCKIALKNNATSYTVNMRKIPLEIMPLEKTGLPLGVSRLITKGRGLVIVTGPTHAGKSTTLAAMVDYINQNYSQHIVTLESPIEYIHRDKKSIVTQRDVPGDAMSFAEGIEDALRQTIGTVMIGEVMDRATVDAMFSVAESGHLVLATMHTLSAEDAIMRLASFYSGEEIQQKLAVLSSVLNGIVGQVLMPSLDGQEWRLGYEMLINDDHVSSAIYKKDTAALRKAFESASEDPKSKMCSLNTCLHRLVQEKQISMASAMMATYDPDGLRAISKGEG